MAKYLTATIVGIVIMAIVISIAGNAVESFTDSIDGTNGVMGSTYVASK